MHISNQPCKIRKEEYGAKSALANSKKLSLDSAYTPERKMEKLLIFLGVLFLAKCNLRADEIDNSTSSERQKKICKYND